MKTAALEEKKPTIVEQISSLNNLPSDELRKLLTQDLGDVAARLVRMAAVVSILESRGEDLSELKIGMIDHLRKIGSGQLLPEIVVRFNGRPSILNVMVNLPLEDQKRIASGEGVALVVPRDGKYDTRMVDPSYMRPEQIRQAFDRDRIRGEAEQIAILEAQKVKPVPIKSTLKRGNIKIDRERVGLILGRSFYPLADILEAIGDLKAKEDEGSRDHVVNCPLSQAEVDRLDTVAAGRSDKRNRTTVIRDALRSMGVI